MIFAAVLVATTVLCVAARTFILRHTGWFYGIVAAVGALLGCVLVFGEPAWLWKASFALIQKCLLPLALFTVVMGIGCLPRSSRMSLWLRPVRAQLSVAACILALGHIAAYAGSYLPRILGPGVKGNVALSFLVAAALSALLLILGATSLEFVKRRMRAESWVKLQRWAYVFFGLVYVHLLCMLLPSALGGGTAAQASVAVYTAVFAAYAVFRVSRAVFDKKPAFRAAH
ncbi:ferric reductase-like transmembrane domain-containing protein [Arabiibacter massiliensis]|uniref:ferric reductase-like transmembrane domain-containing protein n=1 Tax=Arabiibacter massiliensis TaxID=1870985 RepID=UPI0009BB1E95|nr:ferric reductase-like transmembrane domain-containing protein [Arabiibacter massiliensis]